MRKRHTARFGGSGAHLGHHDIDPEARFRTHAIEANAWRRGIESVLHPRSYRPQSEEPTRRRASVPKPVVVRRRPGEEPTRLGGFGRVKNPSCGWYVGIRESGHVEVKKTCSPLRQPWLKTYGPTTKSDAFAARDVIGSRITSRTPLMGTRP